MKIGTTTQAISRALNRLSTGSRISSPKDDAAGFALSVNLESQSRGLRQLAANATDAQSTVNRSQSILDSQLDIVHRMREIAVQASGTTITQSERDNLTSELKNLLKDFSRLSSETPSGSILDVELPTSSAADTLTEIVGVGTFAAIQTIDSGAKDLVEIVDINDDGHLDIVAARSGRGISVQLGDGDGTFQFSKTVFTSGLTINTIGIGDFNGDGIKDIGYIGTGEPAYLAGVGDGTFGASQILSSTTLSVTYGAFADFDNDGTMDLAYSVASDDARIVFNNGSGTFGTASEFEGTIGGASLNYATTDFNNDGFMDLVLQTLGSGTFAPKVFINNRNGGFTNTYTGSTLGAGAGTGVVTGDFNGDGFADLAHADHTFTYIYLGNGNGSFASPAFLTVGTAGDAITVGDINNDGKDDIYTGANNIFLSIGTGSFTLAGSGPTNSLSATLGGNFRLGDFNEDGVLDLVSGEGGMVIANGRSKEVAAGARLTDISNAEKAQNLIEILDRALAHIEGNKGNLSALHSRLDHQTVSQLLMAETLEDSRNNLIGLDYAIEVAELTRLQTLQQAQTAVAAQANVQLSLVLKLLG